MNKNNDYHNSHRLVNLSHLLLSKIINYLDDNVDRICFTLVCKRWFNEKHGYISFRNDHIHRIISDKDKNKIFLNSFKSIYIDSINRKNDLELVVGNDQSPHNYHMTSEKLLEMNEIPSNVCSISFSFRSDYPYLEELYRLISQSNVTILSGCQTLRYRFPENLISLSLKGEFDELLPGYLPPHLKCLNLQKTIINKPIKVGVLPNTLEKLSFPHSYQHPLEPGVLPLSLKSLEYFGNRILEVGSLPPNLEEFEYYGSNDHQILDGTLPLTLRKLTGSLSWIPQIKLLSNLQSLKFCSGMFDNQILYLHYLPSSLTDLVVTLGVLRSTMPPTIKRLDIVNALYDIDEIFKDRSQYQFDYLRINAYKRYELLDHLKIKELELDVRYGLSNGTDSYREVPNGIETLRFGCGAIKIIHEVPASVQTLHLDSIECLPIDHSVILPNTIQELAIYEDEIDEYNEDGEEIDVVLEKQLNSDILPSSLQKLTLYALRLPQPRIPNNVVFDLQSGGYGGTAWLRRLDEHHYLFFSEEPNFVSAIVHESQIPKLFAFYESNLLDYTPRWS
ncbi:hypothetical protein PPL_09462 [Heterostelium album PN500]|uniref:COI1 F-box domain-containing protein n=1 Tax=Heterostelium pallidum (strain ATCC 26659 / Pp 5 / PN500) TaxID=670386 RepID=D3BPJ3_HETP5|nr:hypothetical protein PPL_09462 [Heterostelium album PN500]EFA76711.1 hypothetical protein PPL_09462 [Heterostelium album PN500]|eukprot:XP_020428843.1 hypothetical protein PPL_09462 [Heterostelium album PN500]